MDEQPVVSSLQLPFFFFQNPDVELPWKMLETFCEQNAKTIVLGEMDADGSRTFTTEENADTDADATEPRAV